jgi:dienelactone hydrolase
MMQKEISFVGSYSWRTNRYRSPEPTPTYVYPIMQWVEKGALVLRVNYRGSAGYGAKFRALNVRNLGVGDMWDVVSGVEYLNSKNMIDTSRMGCMGWSQGGYISAFLTTNTNMFKAISVGAGISNWVTYYVNTDITPFTRQYLQATPWSDMDIYLKTSPMTNINKASTPTLIQHGEFDKRVPIPNAYELYRGLQDRKIPSKLIVYKGFGHGINKPKERLAATWHNWQWFNQYVFGEKEETMALDDFFDHTIKIIKWSFNDLDRFTYMNGSLMLTPPLQPFHPFYQASYSLQLCVKRSDVLSKKMDHIRCVLDCITKIIRKFTIQYLDHHIARVIVTFTHHLFTILHFIYFFNR